MLARRSLIATLSILFAISLVIAADSPVLKKTQGGRKLAYTLSNSSDSAVVIILSAFSPNPDKPGKSYKSKVPAQKTKQFTATVFDGDSTDFTVEIRKGDLSLLDQNFYLQNTSIYPPGEGAQGAIYVAPPADHLDIALPPGGGLIWSVNHHP